MRNKYTRIVLILITSFVLFFFFIFKKEEVSHYIDVNKTSEEYTFIENIEQESCLQCHQNTKGYSKHHNPERIGCASCHLGNTNTTNKEESHKGMVLIPGNLSDAKQTCGKCHPSVAKH